MGLPLTLSSRKQEPLDDPLLLLKNTPSRKNPVIEMDEMLKRQELYDKEELIKTLLSPYIYEAVEQGDLEVERMEAAANFLLTVESKVSPIIPVGF